MLSQLTWNGVPVYALCMAAAAVISLIVLICGGTRAGLSRAALGLNGLLSVVLGYLGARIYYILAYNVAGRHGLNRIRFFSPYPFEYAMCGALLGVLLSCVLSAWIVREKRSRMLDAATSPALVMLMLARVSEVFSDFGWGQVLTGEGMRFFPLAVTDMFGQWHGAVFFLEALCAAGVLAYALRCPAGEGMRFARALLWLAVTQIFCESLRAETLRWGFVRVQQIQCAVFALLLMMEYGLKKKKNARELTFRLAVMAVCIGVTALMEYALDKWPWPNALCYAVMAAALLCLGIDVQGVLMAKAE